MIILDEGQQIFGIEMNGMKVIEQNSSDRLGSLQCMPGTSLPF